MAEKIKKTEQNSTKGSWLWGLLVFVLLVIVDQLTKAAADVYFNDVADAPEKIALIPGVLELCISYNRGIAFGALQNSEPIVKMAIVFGTAGVMAIVAIVYLAIDKRRSFVRLALVLIVAGGIGNFIDRVYYQVWDPATEAVIRDGVRDMVLLDFSGLLYAWFGWETNFLNFGVCNFADFFIVIGAVMVVLSIFFFDTDALCPVGKYKALHKEAKDEANKKKADKAKKKAETAQHKADVAQQQAEKAQQKVEKAEKAE